MYPALVRMEGIISGTSARTCSTILPTPPIRKYADLTYERNEFGELTCFSAGQAEVPGRFESRHEYDSLGFELERILPGGVTQSFAYDDIGRLIDSKIRQSSKVRRERKYHWGKADRLLKTEDNRFGTTTYEYSPTGHLQKAVYADGREEYRLSDKAGNLFDDPDRKLRKYLRGGKLEQSGEWRFVYDRDGQLVEKYKGSGKWWDSKSERWRYIWNQNGTLKEVRPPGVGDFAFDALFTYDALGRRLGKDAIGITCWLWNGNVPLHEWTPNRRRNEQGEIEEYQKDLRTWLFEEESFVPLALFQDGKAYSIVTDHLGTPVEAYNEQGEEVWYRRLDMNGKVIEERSMLYTSYKDYIKIPFLFQGQYYDEEIKLAYNRFRYYDPELGRYISEDPIRFASGATALHSYVEDSNTWTDTFGLRAGNTSFLPSELHPGTISAKNPGGIYRIPASGNYHDDKVALYAKAGLSEPFSPDYIAHHISYDPDTNSMEMQLVRSESHQKLSHRGGVKDYEEQAKKYKQNSYAK